MKLIQKIQIVSFVFLMLFSSNQLFAAFPIQTKEGVKVEQPASGQVDTKVDPSSTSDTGKSQLVALILALIVGTLGVHRFYLGYTWQGLVQLFTLGLFGIWTIIDIIFIITGDLQPKDGPYDETL